jgi:hypothetical protein
METLGDILVTKKGNNSTDNFVCEFCDYKCCKKYNWDRHILTSKHIKVTQNEQNEQKGQNKYICEICQRSYESRNGLWKHKQKCNNSNNDIEEKKISENDLIMLLINENKDFKNLLIEAYKEKDEYKNMILKVIENGTNNNSHNTTNSHNKSFNLNFFLNETCKDAMNITDFVDSIKLQLSDLEKVGEIGYVAGISNIIVKNLKELDVTKRPVHCTDKKRETLYVKDENKWEKDEEKKKLRKVIKRVASKNQRLLLKFKEVHPDCNTSSSKYSDQYNTIIVESMGGSGDNDLEKEDKIMRNILKQIVVDKDV